MGKMRMRMKMIRGAAVRHRRSRPARLEARDTADLEICVTRVAIRESSQVRERKTVVTTVRFAEWRSSDQKI